MSGNDVAAGNQGLDGNTHAIPRVVMNGPGNLRLVGPYWPMPVIQIEQGTCCGQVDIGFPVGVNGPHIAPIGGSPSSASETQLNSKGWAEAWLLRTALGNDVLAEIVAGLII